MRRIALSLLLLAPIAVSQARAADQLAATPASPAKPALVQGGDLSFAGLGAGAWDLRVPLTGEADAFGWGPTYRLDAALLPNFAGGYTAGVGAALGAMPGEPGGTYALRIGAGWLPDQYSPRFGGLPSAGSPTPLANDVNMSLTYSRIVTPGLFVTGGAEAHRNLGGTALDPAVETGQVILGGGVGLRF